MWCVSHLQQDSPPPESRIFYQSLFDSNGLINGPGALGGGDQLWSSLDGHPLFLGLPIDSLMMVLEKLRELLHHYGHSVRWATEFVSTVSEKVSFLPTTLKRMDETQRNKPAKFYCGLRLQKRCKSQAEVGCALWTSHVCNFLLMLFIIT